ncbi:outer membrane lipoprotein carrier protein LolA [Microbulbifer hainanensis]|uniref:outer membrane lipoprotein carrier protein LolA n=1 Tax=Microbulbifer hainanensis TaxID=2735675 RepID=UPI0018662F32|nr:outer membrane lipoprotein carrier protein LolA [Microbulbifer hainanensis]
MRILWASAVLCLVASLSPLASALAPEQQQVLRTIEARLQTAPQMLGRFEQKKTLPMLPRPLLSSGVVALSQDKGVSWRVQNPIASHRILSEEQAGGDAMARQIAYPLLQIFRGNFFALDDLFDVAAKAEADQWRVTLTPKAESIAKVITSIEVSGDDKIEQIRLAEANSAVTEMQLLDLHAVRQGDPALSAEFDSPQQEQ